MSKVKKIIVSAIIGLIAILGFYTTANAYYVGQSIGVTYNEYLTNGNIYCVEHGQALKTYNSYRIISQVNIQGNKSTDHTGNTQTNWHNAKLAYILSADNGRFKDSGPVANSVWNNMYTWLRNVGQHHAGLYTGFSNGVPGRTSWLDTESTNYANNYSEAAQISDNTNKANIKIEPYEKDGKSYLRVGPFNWSFSGSMTNVTAQDQDGDNIEGILYSSFNGNNENWYTASDIQSGKDFYISIPTDTKATKITKIIGETSYTLKGVNIWFLESVAGYKQNLIIREPYVENKNISTPIDYDISLYVRLSGYVWVDIADGKREERNDLYKDPDTPDRVTEGEFLPDTKDMLFNGVTVRLRDRRTGEIVKNKDGQEMVTVTSKLDRYKDSVNDGNGEYLFNNVLIAELPHYYVEFEYDGLTYTNVMPPYINENNGSKAAEGEAIREAFNNNFTVVEGKTRNTGFTRDANGNEKHSLSYHINETGYETTLINNGQYTITANTDVTGYNVKDHYTPGEEEIRYINLGLYERRQPDISLMKDLQNVRLTINGYEHTYTYAQRFLNAGEYGDGFNVGVKFGSKYSNMSYTRAIYKADYEYINENDKSQELKVYVTYQIAMSNESASLTAQINSIAEYFDSKYELVSAGTALDEKGNTIGDIAHLDEQGNLVGNVTQTSYNEDYKKAVISSNTRIEPNQKANIYVQFALNREAVINILNDKANLDNVAEINTYSIYDRNGKIYAGIDIDSNPGNCIPGDKTTYEDDTDASPALKLEVADAREMAGKVFLDATSGELMTGQIRQGSGAYEQGEQGIEGVEVTLTETTGSGKVYKATTDANGDFLIEHYIPGDYTLTYTWGDQTYTVQNYKGTVYDNSRNQANKNWYKENVDTRLTDAIDDYNMRQEIDAELKNTKNSTQITKTKMNSNTPIMGIGVEYETTYTASTGDRYVYRINNIDFGIVERARQDVELTKRVATMKATLANGQVIVDLTIDENGKVDGLDTNVTYMKPDPNIEPKNGFIRLELDNELIQGTKLEVGYEIKTTNKSELDYLSENFYKYGIVEGEVVTIEPTAIIDYLDKDWAFEEDKNPQWSIKTPEEIKGLVAEVVYDNEESTISNKTILYTEGLKGQYLEPTKSADIMLNVSKILTTDAEISLNNETELVEITKTGGSKIKSIPGNYIPGAGKTESDDSMAETTIVTPSTGENQNYILPIVVGLTALIILGAGVIIIKRKALKKD